MHFARERRRYRSAFRGLNIPCARRFPMLDCRRAPWREPGWGSVIAISLNGSTLMIFWNRYLLPICRGMRTCRVVQS